MINETIQTIPTGYVPSYFLYIVIGVLLLSFIGITCLYKSKKTNWGKFGWVVLFSVIITSVVLSFLILMPEQIIKLTSFFS